MSSFDSLDERITVRRELDETNRRPPPAGPENILEAESIMAWPTSFSPLS